MTIEELENAVESPEVETPVETQDKTDKLSTRDALEQALAESKGEAPSDESEPTRKEVKAAVEADIEPPQEFSAEAKKAWREKDLPAIQREYSRLHNARTQEIIRAQNSERQAREDAKTWRELGKMAAPYIEARGAEGTPPQQAMMEALALIQEFKKGDPSSVKAELKKIGIDLDATAGSEQKNNLDNSALTTLQKRLEHLEREKENERLEKTTQTFDQIFSNLASLKTRTGEVVFPGFLDNSEAGIEFAKELGSLTQDAKFQQGVLRRFPDADLTILVREAYKYLGGKVSGEPVRVSTSNQKHIEKSRRAAASAPSGTIRRPDSMNLAGKLSTRAALQRAWEEQQEH